MFRRSWKALVVAWRILLDRHQVINLLLEAHHEVGRLHLNDLSTLDAGLRLIHIRQTLRLALELLGEEIQ